MVKKNGNFVAQTQTDANALTVGIDGCRAGWFAMYLPAQGPVEWDLAARWCDLGLEEAAVTAIDMPIGLTQHGPRACDIAARRLLPSARKSSVFPPPRRYMLTCGDWAAAHTAGKTREGIGLSRQAWNITAKIREVDEAITPTVQQRVREVHPELVFHRLAQGRPVPHKRTAAGRAERLRLLTAAGVPGLVDLLAHVPKRAAGADDILDAAACALAARAILAGTATCLPNDPPRDSRGLRMEICY